MSQPSIVILGPGLLGGSVALAAVDSGHEVILWGRNTERVEQTRTLGLDATTDLEEALKNADFVIFAVPVGVMPQLAEQMIPLLKPGALVTDVGSVKGLPHEKVAPILAAGGIAFVGSHPMAGSEQTGVEAARADLLQGAACILTNDERVSEVRVEELELFWQKLGCTTLRMTADGHDRAVARISHYPHAMAVLTANTALKFPGDTRLAGGGFRDTTRVASGDPDMWAEIMIENRAALSSCLQDTMESLREMLVMLENSDDEGLRTYLAEIKQRRDSVQ